MNRKIQSAEHLKTGTQFSLLWSATRRSSPSAHLRSPAEILLLRRVPTHCSFNCTASFCFRDAPNNTIAPRLFASGTHPTTLSRRVLLFQGHNWTSSVLRPHADPPSLHCVPNALERRLPCDHSQVSLYCSASRRTFPFTEPACLQIRMISRL